MKLLRNGTGGLKMTLDEAINHCIEVAEDNDLAAGTYDLLAENNHNLYEKLTAESNSKRCTEFAGFNRQLAEWLTELQELKLQIKAPRLGSIEEYHYELARCKAAFWSCNRRCMNAEEQYRRKADELRKAQEQIAEYKRLLKAAVKDFSKLDRENAKNKNCMMPEMDCADCPLSWDSVDDRVDPCHSWRYADEALKLIGGSENG
jgi:DNA repair ATPase RecN